EHVLLAGRRADEPVALSGIEPFDGALLHRLSPSQSERLVNTRTHSLRFARQPGLLEEVRFEGRQLETTWTHSGPEWPKSDCACNRYEKCGRTMAHTSTLPIQNAPTCCAITTAGQRNSISSRASVDPPRKNARIDNRAQCFVDRRAADDCSCSPRGVYGGVTVLTDCAPRATPAHGAGRGAVR